MKKLLLLLCAIALFASCNKNQELDLPLKTKAGQGHLTNTSKAYRHSETETLPNFFYTTQNNDITITGEIFALVSVGGDGYASISVRLKYMNNGVWNYVDLGTANAFVTEEVDVNGDSSSVPTDSAILTQTIKAPVTGTYYIEVITNISARVGLAQTSISNTAVTY